MADDLIEGGVIRIDASVWDNLDKVDKKIKDIANDSELMAEHFGSAMIRMGNGSSLLLKKLESMKTAISNIGVADMSKFNSVGTSMSSLSDNASQAAENVSRVVSALDNMSDTTSSGSGKINEEKKMYSQMSALIDNMNTKEEERSSGKRKRTDSAIAQEKRQTDAMEREAKRRERIAEREARREVELAKAQERRTNNKAIDAYNRAMASSEATMSQRINKIAKLRQSEEMMSKATKDYSKEIDGARKAMDRLNKENEKQVEENKKVERSHHKLMDTSGQLMRRLALVFSVSQVIGYLRNVREVTGEFEKQNVALASILQNKDKADKLFGQITELAVKSPFNLKELLTYTKSLSAYQIEYEKLFDTTKMLADVSAGLGVDMQRLILAVGQVKASNFLRGTEVRQFTEAGFNILGELAKYYTELEGRMISVGEVQEMVTRRMVSFQDVETVFKRVTSAGGIFYRMQERQAETLAGMWSNLQDSLDLMFNSIGSANQKEIKGFVNSLRKLIENWREIAWYLKGVIGAIGVYKAVTLASTIGNAQLIKSLFGVKDISVKVAQKLTIMGKAGLFVKSVFRGLTTAVGIALIGWLVDLYRQSTKTSREVDRLNKSLHDLATVDAGNLDNLIEGLDNLLTRFEKSNRGSQERKDVIEALNSNYGEYLDFVVEESTSLVALKDAYDDVVDSMKKKQALQTLDKGYQKINQSYTDSLVDAKEDFEKIIARGILKPDGFFKRLAPTEKEIEDIYNILQNKIRGLDADMIDSAQEQNKILQDIIKEYYGGTITLQHDFLKTVPLIDIMLNKKEAELRLEKEINGQLDIQYRTREASLKMNELKAQYEAKMREVSRKEGISDFQRKKELRSLSDKYELAKIDLQVDLKILGKEEAKKKRDKVLNWGDGLTKSLNKKIEENLKGFAEEDIDRIKITQEEQAKGISTIIKDTKASWEQQNSIIQRDINLKNQGLSIDEKSLAKAVKLEKLYRAKANVLGIELNYQEKINKETVKSINEKVEERYRLDLVDQQKTLLALQEEYHKKYEDELKLETALTNEKERGVVVDEEKLKITIENRKAYDQIQHLLGYQDKEKGSGRKNSAIEKLKLQISLIKKAGEEYNKLIGLYNKDEVYAQIKDSFSDAFSDVGLSIDMDFDPSGIVDKLKQMYQQSANDLKPIISKAIAPEDAELGLKLKKDELKRFKEQIDELFDTYNASIEVGKLGISEDFAKKFFSIKMMDFDELRKSFDSLKPIAENGMLDFVEVWEEGNRKIDEIEEKEQIERLKRFSEYLEEYTDKIKQAQEKAARDIVSANQYFDEGKIDADAYVKILQGITRKESEEISKINTDKFKESGEYIQAMGDLSAYSAGQLEKMLRKLEELMKSSSKTTSASDIKVYAKAIANVREQLDKVKWPFEKTEFGKFKEMINLQKEYAAETENNKELTHQRTLKEFELTNAVSDLQDLQNRFNNGEKGGEMISAIADQKGKVAGLNSDLGKINNNINISDNKLSGISGKIGKLAGGAGSTLAMVDMIIKGVYQSIKATIDMFNELRDLAESFGKDTSQGKWQQAGVFFKYMGEMNDKAMAGWESLKKGDAMGASVKSVGAVFSIIKGINALGDNKKEQRIRKEIELIEDLQKSYEKLRDKIDEAYDVDTLSKSTKLMNESLKEQNEALERAIKSEEDKKKTDHNRIKEWREQIEENQKIIKENADELIDSLGGIGSADAVRNAAQEFTDAWLDSYLEVGDGLKGLEDNMKNMMKNVVSKQLTATLAKQYVEPFIKELRKGFDANSLGGIELKSEEIAKVAEAYKQAMVGADKSFTAVLDALKEAGVDISAMGKKDELSGLQKGIQGTSETTSDIIAALMESIRFFSADSNAQLKSMFNMLVNPPVENPFISELRMQTEQLKLMYSLWNGMSKTIPGSGKVLKVQMV